MTAIFDHDSFSSSTLNLSLQLVKDDSSQERDNSEALKYQCIHTWFEAQVKKTPNAISLTFNGQSLTYQELNQRANQLAHYLIDQGIQPGELVAISMHRCFEMIVGFWGVLKAGAAYVPIDPAYPHERQSYMLQDSQARIILTQQSLVESLSTVESLSADSARVLCLDTDWETAIAAYPCHNPALPASSEQPAYVIYTSGSTGNPKGVKIPHRGVVNHSRAIVQAFELSPRDRVLQFSSISFDIIVEEVYPSLVTGASLVLRTEEISSSIRQFLGFVEAHHITVLDLPTAFWHELVKGLSLLKLTVPPSVRLVVVGGEKASRIAYAEWIKLVGNYPRWLNTYGPTETTVTATIYDPIAAHYHPDQGEIPIGKPLANTEVYILDTALRPVAFGEVGELHLGGPGLAIEYHNRPDRTAEKFIANPFSDDPTARLYKTGDTVRYLPDGNLEFVGRIDFQVKIRGFRIELGEIETCLEQHSAIRQAIVLAREDVPGDKSLVAYVMPHPEQSFDAAEVRSYLKQKLPAYMVPAAFVEMEVFPLTPNGKVDRRALPAPQTVTTASPSIVAPSNATEAKLLQIWEEILGIRGISIHDNFFDLGGHSLLVARLFARLEQEFRCSLPMTAIFQAPTITQLAIQLQTALEVPSSPLAEMPSLVRFKEGTAQPPLFLVLAFDLDGELYLNLANHYQGDRPIYGLQFYGHNHTRILHTRIPDMAAFIVEQLRLIQPEGPYLLGGQCAGGVIAFEVAQQLQAQGHQVALLALLDAADVKAKMNLKGQLLQLTPQFQSSREATPAALEVDPETTLSESDLNHSAPELASPEQNDSPEESWEKSPGKLAQILEKILNKVDGIFKARQLDDHLQRGLPVPSDLQTVSSHLLYDFAVRHHHPKGCFDGNVMLLRATEGDGSKSDEPFRNLYHDPLFGWGKRVTRSIQVHDVPGGHGTMLDKHHAAYCARKLQDAIEAVLPKNP